MMMSNINNLAVIDIETSGPNPFVHDILSIAIVPLNKTIETLSLFVRNRDIEWTEFSKNIFSKYSDAWELKAVDPHVACDRIERYLRDNFFDNNVTPIGHNIGFDVSFIRKLAYLGGREQLKYLSHRAIDTHTMLYVLFLKNLIPINALSSDGAFEYFHIVVPDEMRHTALGDALATRELFVSLANRLDIKLNSNGISNIEDSHKFMDALTDIHRTQANIEEQS